MIKNMNLSINDADELYWLGPLKHLRGNSNHTSQFSVLNSQL